MDLTALQQLDLQQVNIDELESVVRVLCGGYLVLGLLNCFFGFRLFRFMLALAGFLAGAGLGAIAAQQMEWGGTLQIVLAGAGAVIGALLLYFLHHLVVFAAGAGAGAGAALGVLAAMKNTPHLAVVLIAGIVGGALALLLRKPLIVLGSSIGGAVAVGAATLQLVGYGLTQQQLEQLQADPQAGQQVLRDLATTEFYFAAIGTLLLAVAGLCVQFGSGGKDAEKQGEEDEKEKD